MATPVRRDAAGRSRLSKHDHRAINMLDYCAYGQAMYATANHRFGRD
ncbi:hypothetical protein [Rhodanobacter sp. DHB23]|nr:hypothetical protein [Rhodanobacter sp. DHB23]MBD8873665.1 hypothetical protein [Rhodanobacter sp. DHB23]